MPANENLALLYQGILTGIVRIQSGRQPIQDANAFRRRMKEAFLQIERDGIKLDLSADDLRQANYAVVAFLDETVLNSKDSARPNWPPLQAEMFERAIAGDSVFDQIERLDHRPDSPQLAEILEVHALCLLLGYQGRYAMESSGELDRIIRSSLSRISRIRGEQTAFSPSGLPIAVAETGPSRPNRRLPGFWWLAAAPMILAVWLLFSWHLSASVHSIQSVAGRALTP